MEERKVIGIIIAGGVGNRMGQAIPKQFIHIDENDRGHKENK